MKITYAILFIIVVLLACGCTATSPAEDSTATAPTGIPDITGTWTGYAQGYDEKSGFTDYGNSQISIVVTEQQGRIFAGNILAPRNGSIYATPIAGVIGRDGRTFSMVEKNNGYTTGEIVSNDTIELIWRNDGTSFGAALDTLKRV